MNCFIFCAVFFAVLICGEKIFEYQSIYPPPYNSTKVYVDLDVDFCETITVALFSKSPFFGVQNGFPITESYRQCVHPYDDVVSNTLKARHFWADCLFPVRLWFQYFVKKYSSISQYSIFVDAGGNIGSCSLAMLSFGVRTVAFEPVPTNLLYFQRSVVRNVYTSLGDVLRPRPRPFKDLITLYPIALGAVKGTSTIFVEPGNAGNSVLNMPPTQHGNGNQILNFTVDVETLDQMLWPDPRKEPPIIGVMKVDVQGFESHALKGARRLLEVNAIKIIQFELDSDALNAAGSTMTEVVTMLKGHGFSIHRFKAKVTVPVIFSSESLLDMDSLSHGIIRVMDLIAVHSSIWTL